MPSPSSMEPSAVDSEDFTIAVKTLLLTAPHMTDEQLFDVVELGRELLRARSEGGETGRLFAKHSQRPAEKRSFDDP